jgi:hypothetical protein
VLKRLLAWPVCLIRGHSRSNNRVREVGDTYVSVCRRCGVAMRRGHGRVWKADRLARQLRGRVAGH